MDPRQSFFDSIDSNQCKVDHYPGFILVCGGQYNKAEQERYFSARDYLLKTTSDTKLLKNIELAEEINDWWKEGAYSDLISLEKDVAELAGLIVIFLESPGSIAEFSAFSQVRGVREKLLVFIDDKYSREDSFITLGPLLSLKMECDDAVKPYPWMKAVGCNHEFDLKSIVGCRDEMEEDILSAYGNKNNKALFARAVVRHQMLLIYDLIDLMLALTITEIESYLPEFDIQIERRRLTQYLFLLEKFKLIRSMSRGKKFYLSRLNRPLVSYSVKVGSPPFDRERTKHVISKYYDGCDEKRRRVIRDVLKGSGEAA